MNVKHSLILLVNSVFLTSCALFTDGSTPVKVQTVAAEKTPLKLREPDPIKLKQIEWFIITPENADRVFAEMKAKNIKIVLFGLSDTGYKNISNNLAEIRSYIVNQGLIIKAYKEYYEPNEGTVKK